MEECPNFLYLDVSIFTKQLVVAEMKNTTQIDKIL